MAMDDSGQMSDDKQGNSLAPGQESGDSQGSAEGSPESASDRTSRMNAAKAFYRAMYAGEDVDPQQFGMGMTPEHSERAGPCMNCQLLESQLNEAQQKASESENLYKRMAADFENYRRRIDREREEFQALGIQKAVEALLPALDDLDRARTSLGNVTDPKSIIESIGLVHTRFMRCLEQIGVKPLEVVGEPFDPRSHEPVQEIATSEFPEGSVIHELRRGYLAGQKVLRPALVNVAAAQDKEGAHAAGEGRTSDFTQTETKAQATESQSSRSGVQQSKSPSDAPLTGVETCETEIVEKNKSTASSNAAATPAPSSAQPDELAPGTARARLSRKKEREQAKGRHQETGELPKHEVSDQASDNKDKPTEQSKPNKGHNVYDITDAQESENQELLNYGEGQSAKKQVVDE
jgi:molecular chaperone GrpE